jgi:CheY-like chemotaxis protein
MIDRVNMNGRQKLAFQGMRNEDKSNDHHILMIDDNVHDSFLLHEALTEIDPRVTTVNAFDGFDALHKLDYARKTGTLPSLITLDINMPRMNGVEALTAIRSHTRFSQIPLVILSTSSYEPERQFFLERGVKMFTKPFTHGELIHIAAQLLSISRPVSKAGL